MTPERIAEIRARLEAATPGPWLEVSDLPMYAIAGPGRYRVVATPNQNSHRYARPGETIDTGIGNAMDAAFIAAAPTDVADLLAEVERLTAQIARVEAVCKQREPEEWDTSGEPYLHGFEKGLYAVIADIRRALAAKKGGKD